MNQLTADIELTDNGSFQAVLDAIQTGGIPAAEGRAFATWLEGQVQALRDANQKLTDDFRDYCDENPAKQFFQPHAETFYHPTKEAAREVEARLTVDPRIAQTLVQFEPNNGWVVVVVPALCDLSDLKPYVEVQDGRPNAMPIGKVRAYQPPTAPDRPIQGAGQGAGPAGAAAAPSKGATARVWVIADAVTAEKGGTIDRAAIIARCEAEGINPSTAGTQYSKWKKARS